MKVKLLSPYSGADGSWGAGEVVQLPDDAAYRMVRSGLAEPASPAEKKKLEKLEKLEAEREAKREDEERSRRIAQLEERLRSLFADAVRIEAEIAGVELDDETAAKLVEELMERDTRVGLEKGKDEAAAS